MSRDGSDDHGRPVGGRAMTATCQHCAADVTAPDLGALALALSDHYGACPLLPRVPMAPTQLERRRGVGRKLHTPQRDRIR